MDKLGMQMYLMLQWAKRGFRDFMEEERGAVDIVAIVVLIGIAVMLALFFRDQIKEILDHLFQNIDDATSGATSKIS